ncbi:MAG TPA: hypothetical protein VHY48_10725 [Acidobacteriaceae bacterium]|jgi:hypothetical protein|nr:hypothetical protein [Acidobacteriaceae bacterium]
MSPRLPSPLPLFDHALLCVAQKIVPCTQREEWLDSWRAELWHIHHASPGRRPGILRLAVDLPLGLLLDALWLRTHSWRRTFSGTPTLCLASLQALCLLSFLIALASYGGWHTLGLHLSRQAEHCLLAAPFILFVSCATATSHRIERTSTKKTVYWINRQLFFAAKTSLVLLLAFLLSTDLSRPFYVPFPTGADLLQILFFVILALVSLRWSFFDQEQRCKQCLRYLATPARVGRPSHNLLEWNGTEQICKQGHGLLSIPEMESSWRQSSQWIDPPSGWNEPASI